MGRFLAGRTLPFPPKYVRKQKMKSRSCPFPKKVLEKETQFSLEIRDVLFLLLDEGKHEAWLQSSFRHQTSIQTSFVILGQT